MEWWQYFTSHDDSAGKIATAINNQNRGTSLNEEQYNQIFGSSDSNSGDMSDSLGIDKFNSLSAETKDYLIQYYLNNKLARNSFERELAASNTSYQRAVRDLQKAGINPFLALSGLSGADTPSSSAGSVEGGLFSAKRNKDKDIEAAAIRVMGIIAAVVMRAIL